MVHARSADAKEEPPHPGWMLRVGEASILALGIALFASVPTGLRASAAGESFPAGLLLGAAVLLPLLALTLGLVRAAGRGFRGIASPGSIRVVALGIAIWVGLSTPLLVGLGAVLKATTHHRGLGGATFAVLAMVVVAFAALLSRRLTIVARGLVERGVKAWIIAAVGAAIGVVPILLVAATLAPGGDGELPSGAAVRAAILDGAIALVATAFVASIELPPKLRRIAGTWGVPIAAVFVFANAFRVEAQPALARAVRDGGGLAATLLGALEDWTDRDGDGSGSHFGGTDCDEGDPARNASATEIPGDGIDQDCDGSDGPAIVATRDAVIEAHVEAPVEAPKPAAAAAPSAAVAAAAAAGPTRPDIVLVTLDTVRADRTSVYGYERDTTPHLGELAKRGVVFEHAYATGSDTQRALIPLVSGARMSQTARDRREWPTIQGEVDTLAERLQKAGYATAAVTSFTWLSEERGFAQGFDHFTPVFGEAHPEREVTGAYAEKAALAILEGARGSKAPLFLWVHLFDAHGQYRAHPEHGFGKSKSDLYDGEVAFVDDRLGAIMAAVAAGPRASQTAFVVHGSHGEGFFEHEVLGHGGHLYEELIRVPLVIALPGESDAKRYSATAVSTIDVAETILAIAGAPAMGLEGVSLLPAARGDEAFRREPVYARAERRAAVVDLPLKLIRQKRAKRDRLLLFDVLEDPGETKDLSSGRPDDLQRMLAKIEAIEGA